MIASDGAEDAANIQAGASREGVAEQRRQFDQVRQLLQPYVDFGRDGLNYYTELAGLNGPGIQSARVKQIESGPEFQFLAKQGEDAILANASATGGLRGGNTQAALAGQRTNLLSSLIERQLGRYGEAARMGQNSAAGVGTAALTTGQQISGLLQQGGAAMAGGQLAGANALAGAVGNIGGILGSRMWQPSVTPAATGYGGAGITGGGGFGSGVVFGNQDLGQYF